MELDGIGPKTAAIITEVATSGSTVYLDKLEEETSLTVGKGNELVVQPTVVSLVANRLMASRIGANGVDIDGRRQFIDYSALVRRFEWWWWCSRACVGVTRSSTAIIPQRRQLLSVLDLLPGSSGSVTALNLSAIRMAVAVV